MPIRDERQRGQVRASSEARNVALRRLRDAHRDEYDRYYIEECAKRGVTAYVARAEKERRQIAERLRNARRANNDT